MSHAAAYKQLVAGLERVLDASWHLVDRARTGAKGIDRCTSIALMVETDIGHVAPKKNDDSPSMKSFYVHTMSTSALAAAARTKKEMLIECSEMIAAMTAKPTVSEGVYAMPQDHWTPS